ncbi:phosphatase PAP2 family protein [Seleniivibrio woodruffii]|uniref:phosphatase PAP2 family protein n=1 Tax=Seleniivibrio woodruffii TaxID=1078050 RepID=UPI0026F191AE|nr:phosphatase PAP2 family protein [Seleniivibrio woodruffii]
MKNIITVLILLISLSAHAFDNDDADKSGDAMRVALPLAALYTTILHDDKEGALQFSESFLANVAATYALKETVKKDRPDESGNDAFPSGHASVTFQAATFLQMRYGTAYGVPAYLAAGYTSWTRLAADEHDETDILAGALLGAASAYFLTTPNVTIMPHIDKKSVGASITFRLP